MIRVILILLLIIPVQGFANETSLAEIRSLYHKATTQEKFCKTLSQLQVPKNGINSSVIAGYKAAATIIMAKYSFNPATKISYFRKGQKMLEAAIFEDKKNVELRYLRFTIQTNAPSFLGYSSSIKADREFLTAALPSLTDLTLKQMITRYLNKMKD